MIYLHLILIPDFFGGEILNTNMKNGWLFYYSIDGKDVDFNRPYIGFILNL